MTEYIWKKLEDIKLPRCVICMNDITRDYFVEIKEKIICEGCAKEVNDAFSQL